LKSSSNLRGGGKEIRKRFGDDTESAGEERKGRVIAESEQGQIVAVLKILWKKKKREKRACFYIKMCRCRNDRIPQEGKEEKEQSSPQE